MLGPVPLSNFFEGPGRGGVHPPESISNPSNRAGRLPHFKRIFPTFCPMAVQRCPPRKGKQPPPIPRGRWSPISKHGKAPGKHATRNAFRAPAPSPANVVLFAPPFQLGEGGWVFGGLPTPPGAIRPQLGFPSSPAVSVDLSSALKLRQEDRGMKGRRGPANRGG